MIENAIENTVENVTESTKNHQEPVQNSTSKSAETSNKTSTESNNQSGVHVMTDEEKLEHRKKMEAYFNEKHATHDPYEQEEIYKKYFGNE